MKKSLAIILSAIALTSCGVSPEDYPKAKNFKLVGTYGDRTYHIGPIKEWDSVGGYIWAMNNLDKPTKADAIYDANETYQSTLKLIRYYCEGKEAGTFWVRRYYLYQKTDLSGRRLLDSGLIFTEERERVGSDDISQAFFNEACRRVDALNRGANSPKGQSLGQQFEKITLF